MGWERRDRDLAVGDAVQLGYAACSVAPHANAKASLFVAERAVVESKAEVRVVTHNTFQLARFWLKAVAELNVAYIVVTDAVFQLPTFWLKTDVPENTLAMLDTLATFHLPMSALKAVLPLNRLYMLLTAAVFQSPMLPYAAAAVVGSVAHAVAAVAMLPFVMQ